MQLAELRWFAPRDKILGYRLRTSRGGELAALGIDFFLNHPRRRRKRLGIAILRQCHGSLHELRPDRGSRRAARQFKVAVIVKPNPDDAEQIRGKTHEPT